MIKRGQAVTLSDNTKYLVLSTVEDEEENIYLYLTSMDDEHKTMICKEETGKLINIEDEETKSKIMDLFGEDIKDML